jgi:hypothetical protein
MNSCSVRAIERFRCCEIAADDFDAVRELCLLWVAAQGANRDIGRSQLRDDLPADIAGRTCDENPRSYVILR